MSVPRVQVYLDVKYRSHVIALKEEKINKEMGSVAGNWSRGRECHLISAVGFCQVKLFIRMF